MTCDRYCLRFPARVRKLLTPMLSNIPPPGDPDLACWLRVNVLHKLLQRAEATGFADDPAVQPYRHHLRRAGIPF